MVGAQPAMDLAKMLAILDVISPLVDWDFHIWKQTRSGLLSYPVEPNAARAHLATSVYMQMALKPHIVHVVAHTEAHHAATANDIIEAVNMAWRSIENAMAGQPDYTGDPMIQERRDELVRDANLTLDAIRALAEPGIPDALIDPGTLTKAVNLGLLDAPHLCNNPFARGAITSRLDERGACVAYDVASGHQISEKERIARLSK